MFGCGLPVLSARYACIDELVQENRTGLLFRDASQLAAGLQQLLDGFPARPSSLLAQLQVSFPFWLDHAAWQQAS